MTDQDSKGYYSVLEINKDASPDDIKKAYRKLSLKYHPDKNGGATVEMFQKISEAYETLSDPQKKQEYDMGGSIHMNMGMPNMDDIFQQFFGMNMGGLGGMRMHRMDGQGMPGGIHIIHNGIPINLGGGFPGGGIHNMFQQNFVFEKPTPIIKTIEVSMEQVLTGANIPVDIERWIVQNQTKVFEKEVLYVSVPQGVDDNELILLRDKGNVANENCKGDVKIFISVKNNTSFQRKGLDLILEKTLTLKESLCGFNFEFIYINGKTFTINNTGNTIIKPNQEKTVNGLGLTRDGHTGNLTINFIIDFPDSLSPEKIEKLKEIL